MINEFLNPTNTLKSLPLNTAQLLERYLEGIREIACVWISTEDLVAFTYDIDDRHVYGILSLIDSGRLLGL